MRSCRGGAMCRLHTRTRLRLFSQSASRSIDTHAISSAPLRPSSSLTSSSSSRRISPASVKSGIQGIFSSRALSNSTTSSSSSPSTSSVSSPSSFLSSSSSSLSSSSSYSSPSPPPSSSSSSSSVPSSSSSSLRRIPPAILKVDKPVPAELTRSADAFPRCASCGKHFASERGLRGHSKRCAMRHKCSVCLLGFSRRDMLRLHERRHLPARDIFRCSGCKDVFLTRSYKDRHEKECLKNPTARRRRRFIDISPSSVKDSAVFSHPQPCLDQVMSHATSLRAARSIFDDGIVRGLKNSSMILDGPLLFDENAPACAHFALLPANAGARPFVSFVPSFAEPSELCTRLLFDLGSLFRTHTNSDNALDSTGGSRSHSSAVVGTEEEVNDEDGIVLNIPSSDIASNPHSSPAQPRLYFVSCGNENFRGQSSVRVTLLVTRDREAQAWADAADSGCVPLDVEDNSILCRRRGASGGRPVWEVASAIAWEGELRKLRVTVCVANGLPFGEGVIPKPDSELVVRTHWEGKSARCSLCDQTFFSYEALFAHCVRVHQEGGFLCKVCDTRFVSHFDYRRHTAVHDDTRYPCDHCSESFANRSLRRSHVDSTHPEVAAAPVKCDDCGKLFKAKSALRYHILARHSEHTYPCSQCGKVYQSHSGLYKHQRTFHSEERGRLAFAGHA